MDASRMILITDLGEGGDTLRLRAYDAKGVPITASLPTVLLDNAKEGIGPLVVPVKDRGEGNYDMPWALFTPHGEWRIAITFKQQEAYDINATIGIDYPPEIFAARTKALTPRFGTFEILVCIIVLVLSILSLMMLFFVRRNSVFTSLQPEYDTEQSSIGVTKATLTAFTALISLLAIVVMLRILLPFYSEEISDGKITPAHMHEMPWDMSGMRM
jgi:hypothetical protein